MLTSEILTTIDKIASEYKGYPLIIQPRFMKTFYFNKIITRLENIKIKKYKNYIKIIKKYDKDSREIDAYIIPINSNINYIFDEMGVKPVIVMILGKRNERQSMLSTLNSMGIRRGWVRQKTIRNIDKFIEDFQFELQLFVYELRMYIPVSDTGRKSVFIAAGTANFYPEGVSSIREALEEFLSPIKDTKGYYIFIKSIRFRLYKNNKNLGTYGLNRNGGVILDPNASLLPAKIILQRIFTNILKNYMEYTIGYKVSVVSSAKVRAYLLRELTEVYLSALEPGRDFFTSMKLYLGKPTIWGKTLAIIPIEVGNPRIVSQIIDRTTGNSVIVVATFEGIRILPAPGYFHIDAETIDNIVKMLRNFVSDEPQHSIKETPAQG